MKSMITSKTQILQEACRFYMLESAFALTIAFLINISVISVSGAVCNSPSLNAEDQKSCQDLDLNKASFLLRVHIYIYTHHGPAKNIENKSFFLFLFARRIDHRDYRTCWEVGAQSSLRSRCWHRVRALPSPEHMQANTLCR